MPQIKIDLTQPSTIRGIASIAFGLIAVLVLVITKDASMSAAVMGIGQTVSGSLGVMLDDNKPNDS